MDKASKKRAVTKVVKKVVKKPTTVGAKVAVAKKPAIKKRVTKKTVIKKVMTEKVEEPSEMISLNERIKSKLAERKIALEKEAESVKFIPGEISLRLKERVKIYRAWYNNNSFSVARPLTQVFGYLFIAVGLFSAYIYTLDENSPNLKMLANISCALGSCTELSAKQASTTEPVKNDFPQVSFATIPEINLEQNTEFYVSTKQVDNLSLYLMALKTGKKIIIDSAGEAINGRYNYLLPTKTLPSGDYKIFANVRSSVGKIKAEFKGPTFIIPEALPMATPATNTTAVLEEATSQQNSKTEPTVAVEEEAKDISLPESSVTEIPTEAVATSTVSDTDFSVSISSGIYSGQKRIFVRTDEVYSRVELSAQLKNSNQTLYLGEATSIEHGWLYWLDANTLPSGRYNILIQAFADSKPALSTDIDFINAGNEIDISPTITEDESETADETQIKELTNEEKPRQSLLMSSQTTPLSLILNTDEAVTPLRGQKEAREILNENSKIFNDLFRRYASTNGTTELNLARLSEKAIDEAVVGILTKMVEDNSLQGGVKDVGLALESEVANIKERILKLKTLRETGVESQDLIDSDNDGIADYEEVMLYKTDPKQVDSDNDGVTDGIEISLGFNPLDNSPEAIINYNSPRTASYTDGDLIGVNNVNPLLVYETGQEEPKIQSEISGYALPNSFVTIYVFSEPSVFITKTGDDGTFSFTFNKEIEDGPHQVYLALTDNRGDIIVRSDVYNFTKNSAVYTKFDPKLTASALDSVTEAAPTNMSGNIVMALGVVSLGLILLLLAQTLRQEKIKSPQTT